MIRPLAPHRIRALQRSGTWLVLAVVLFVPMALGCLPPQVLTQTAALDRAEDSGAMAMGALETSLRQQRGVDARQQRGPQGNEPPLRVIPTAFESVLPAGGLLLGDGFRGRKDAVLASCQATAIPEHILTDRLLL